MADHVATTQQQHPARAALRTAVQVFIALPATLLVVAAILTVVAQDAFAQYLPEGWVAWLVGAAAVCATLAGLLARVMAIPAVDRALKRLGLSSSPSA